MPKYELTFTSIVTVEVEADSIEEANEIGLEYDVSGEDWVQNCDYDGAEEIEE